MKDWKFCTVIVDKENTVYSVQPRETFVIETNVGYKKEEVFQKLKDNGWELSESHTELTQKESIVGKDFLTFIFRKGIV